MCIYRRVCVCKVQQQSLVHCADIINAIRIINIHAISIPESHISNQNSIQMQIIAALLVSAHPVPIIRSIFNGKPFYQHTQAHNFHR